MSRFTIIDVDGRNQRRSKYGTKKPKAGAVAAAAGKGKKK